MPENRGQIGVLGAAAIGVGGMVGGGIFAVLGTAVDLAGGATPIAFLLAGAVALVTAYSYAKLSVSIPNEGGTVAFLDEAFGIDLATGSVNLILWLSYLVTIALYASAFGAYGTALLGSQEPAWIRHAIMSGGILLPATINLLNTDLISRAETAIVVVKLVLLAVVVAAGASQVDAARLAPSTWPGPLPLVAGGMVIFVAYEGFELIANVAKDVRDPERTLPRAFIGSVVFVIALYAAVAVVTVGSVAPAVITRAEDYALAEAARPALGHPGFVLVSISALLATFSAINATLYGDARLGYLLAKDGELPKPLEKKAWGRPVEGVLITTGLSLLLANLVDLTAIAILGSAGFLLIFTAVNAAAWKLAGRIGARRVVAGVGIVACLGALAALLYHTYEDAPASLWTLFAFVVAAMIFEILYPRWSGRGLHPGNRASGQGIGSSPKPPGESRGSSLKKDSRGEKT